MEQSLQYNIIQSKQYKNRRISLIEMTTPMFSLGIFEVLLKKSAKQTIMDPQKLLYKLGSQCLTCQKKIIFSSCTSICQCQLYCHISCIKQQLTYKNLQPQNIVSCKLCKRKINITFNDDQMAEMMLKLKNWKMLVIGLLINLIMIVMVVFGIMNQFEKKQTDRNQANIVLFFTFLALIICTILTIILIAIFPLRFVVKDVKMQKKLIVASAFQGIQTQVDDAASTNAIFT